MIITISLLILEWFIKVYDGVRILGKINAIAEMLKLKSHYIASSRWIFKVSHNGMLTSFDNGAFFVDS